MTTRTLLVAATALSLIAMPAIAQTTTKTDGGHHYSGGPKSEVPHHVGKKKVTKTEKKEPSGSHHYSGGPREPHHLGPK